jgi:hypothetical protein
MRLSDPAIGAALIIGFGLALGFGARFILRRFSSALLHTMPPSERAKGLSRRKSIAALVLTFAMIFGIGLAIGVVALPMLAAP